MSIAQVNLTGTEGRLAYEMEQLVSKAGNENIKYEAFDFHKECGHTGTRWDRLGLLMDRLQADQDDFG